MVLHPWLVLVEHLQSPSRDAISLEEAFSCGAGLASHFGDKRSLKYAKDNKRRNI